LGADENQDYYGNEYSELVQRWRFNIHFIILTEIFKIINESW